MNLENRYDFVYLFDVKDGNPNPSFEFSDHISLLNRRICFSDYPYGTTDLILCGKRDEN